MRAAALTLAALEIAVGGGRAALARQQAVRVHRQAHGAARLAPLEAGSQEHLVQTLGLRLRLHQAGARHHQHLLDIGGLVAALGHAGGLAQILDAAIGTGADEDDVHRDVVDGGVGLQAHIAERALNAAFLHRIAFPRRVRHRAVDIHHHLRRSAPGHLRQDLLRAQHHFRVEYGARIGTQSAPIRHRPLPLLALGRKRPAFYIIDGLLVHRHHARARAGLNRHIAQAHPAFHRQALDGLAGKLDRIAGAAGGADLADDGQRHILAGDAAAQLAIHPHQHILGFLGHQALRGHHMLHLGGADAMRQRGESAVSGGVAIAAHHGHARQRGALLRPHHVHDALTLVLEREVRQRAEGLDIGVQRFHLLARDRVLDALVPMIGGRVVIRGGHHRIHAPQRAARQLQPFERLRAGHLVHQVAVDVQQGRAVRLLAHHVAVP